MTADQLAKELGVSRRLLFRAKTLYPKEAPRGFSDVARWKSFLEFYRSIHNPSMVPEIVEAATAKVSESIKGVSLTTAESNARYAAARANKTQIAAEMASIQLSIVKRTTIGRKEVEILFAGIAAVVRGRFLRMAADLPCSCVGLSEPQIETVVMAKIREALSEFRLKEEFFEPQSFV